MATVDERKVTIEDLVDHMEGLGTPEVGKCSVCGHWNDPASSVCNCANKRLINRFPAEKVTSEWDHLVAAMEPTEGGEYFGDTSELKCSCGPKETCPICKEEKLAAGISPKFDQGKLRYSLVPPAAVEALAEVLTFGAQKYAPNSWQGVEDGENRYMDALYRHLEAYRRGEKLDDDSGLSHLSHAITNLAFLTHFDKNPSE